MVEQLNFDFIVFSSTWIGEHIGLVYILADVTVSTSLHTWGRLRPSEPILTGHPRILRVDQEVPPRL